MPWWDDFTDRNSPSSPSTFKLVNSLVMTGSVRVYGWAVYSSNVVAQHIQMFDASGVPADGAVPLMNFPVATVANVGTYYGPMGRVFNRGLVLCNSTTGTTKTIGAADCLFDVQLDYLY